jgi:hypothetical protein
LSSGFGRIVTEQLVARGGCIAGTVRDLSLKAELGHRLWQSRRKSAGQAA